MPKFSIIMPTWNRKAILPRTIASILNQTYTDFELLIMDDGSTDGTWDLLSNLAIGEPRVRIFRHDKPRERIICRSKLMEEANGEWILWVDSDDEIIYGMLEVLAHNIALYPDFKVFNWGQVVMSLTGTTIKVGQQLPEAEDLPGHDHFDTGLVGTGAFMFHRDLLPVVEKFPQVDNVFDFADQFGAIVEDWFAKNRPGKEHQRYNRDDKWCGNPWGDDFVFMWLLTRAHKSKKIPITPYIAYIRTENWAYEFSDGSGVMGGSTKGI